MSDLPCYPTYNNLSYNVYCDDGSVLFNFDPDDYAEWDNYFDGNEVTSDCLTMEN